MNFSVVDFLNKTVEMLEKGRKAGGTNTNRGAAGTEINSNQGKFRGNKTSGEAYDTQGEVRDAHSVLNSGSGVASGHAETGGVKKLTQGSERGRFVAHERRLDRLNKYPQNASDASTWHKKVGSGETDREKFIASYNPKDRAEAGKEHASHIHHNAMRDAAHKGRGGKNSPKYHESEAHYTSLLDKHGVRHVADLPDDKKSEFEKEYHETYPHKVPPNSQLKTKSQEIVTMDLIKSLVGKYIGKSEDFVPEDKSSEKKPEGKDVKFVGKNEKENNEANEDKKTKNTEKSVDPSLIKSIVEELLNKAEGGIVPKRSNEELAEKEEKTKAEMKENKNKPIPADEGHAAMITDQGNKNKKMDEKLASMSIDDFTTIQLLKSMPENMRDSYLTEFVQKSVLKNHGITLTKSQAFDMLKKNDGNE